VAGYEKIGSRKDSAFMCARRHLTDGPQFGSYRLEPAGMVNNRVPGGEPFWRVPIL